MKYQVVYTAVYYVDARDEDHALELGAEKHAEFPDGEFSAVPDPYVSPLEQLEDGTYAITEAHSYPVRVHKVDGFWVAVEAVESIPTAGQHLGVWTDANGKRYYDRSVHINDRHTAIELGKIFNQLSIWDCAKNEAIPLR